MLKDTATSSKTRRANGRRHDNSFWTQARVQTLRDQVRAKKSSGQIAAILGCTRRAVVGKAYRLKLAWLHQRKNGADPARKKSAPVALRRECARRKSRRRCSLSVRHRCRPLWSYGCRSRSTFPSHISSRITAAGPMAKVRTSRFVAARSSRSARRTASFAKHLIAGRTAN